jgi:hypothetical protein
MTLWLWVLIGIGAYLVVAAVAAVAVAVALGRIGRTAADEEQAEAWATAPLTRERHSAKRSRTLSKSSRR